MMSFTIKSSISIANTGSPFVVPGAGGRVASTFFLFPFPSDAVVFRLRLAGVGAGGVTLVVGELVPADGDIS